MAKKKAIKKVIKKAPAPVEPAGAPAVGEKRILDCNVSRDPQDDWQLKERAAAGFPMLAAANVPDLRAPWWPVENQHDKGACVGWALADSVLRWLFVKKGTLAPATKLSPRFLWMAAKETDEYTSRPETFIERAGTSLKAALDIARKYGCVTENELPIDSGNLYPGDPDAFFIKAASYKITRYFRLLNQQEWKNWLTNVGPILIRVEVDQTWRAVNSVNPILDIYNPYPPGHSLSGGHAVAIVGQKDGNFIIRNSWGAAWGDGGFAYATPLYVNDAVSEAYGVEI